MENDKLGRLLKGVGKNDDSNSSKLPREFAGLAKMINKMVEEEDRVEAKRIPIAPEWKALHDECMEMFANLHTLTRKLEHKARKLWTTVQEDTDEYRDMHYDEEKMEIVVYEDDI